MYNCLAITTPDHYGARRSLGKVRSTCFATNLWVMPRKERSNWWWCWCSPLGWFYLTALLGTERPRAVSTQKRSQRCWWFCWWRRYGFYCGKSVTEKIKWCPAYADSKAFCVGGILKHSQNASSSTLNSFVYHEKMLAKRDTVNWNMEMRLMQFRCSPIGLATWIGNYFVSLI